MYNELAPEIEELLLSCFPMGTQVIEAHSYRPDYMPYPMRVHLQPPAEGLQSCVIKINRHDLIEREVQALRLLTRLGLPVPQALSESLPIPMEERAMVVLSELQGRPLPWCGITSLTEADLTCHLVLEGVARLHQLTDPIHALDTAGIFPRNTLDAEYAAIIDEAGAWMSVDTFERAVEALQETLAEAATSLVFSNGDYNPLNFLYDGQTLCGFVDFEGACFENPHIGFAKFLIWSMDEYGWGTGKKAGLVERYLYTHNVSCREFAPILVLRSLRHLIREVPLESGKGAVGGEPIFQIIEEGLEVIEKG